MLTASHISSLMGVNRPVTVGAAMGVGVEVTPVVTASGDGDLGRTDDCCTGSPQLASERPSTIADRARAALLALILTEI